MSITVKFTISEEEYQDLCNRAATFGLSVQDYIRRELFPESDHTTAVTPQNAVDKALQTYKAGALFTIPELFGEDWNIPNGHAGQFGRKFSKLVKSEYYDKIIPTGMKKNNHMVYEIL